MEKPSGHSSTKRKNKKKRKSSDSSRERKAKDGLTKKRTKSDEGKAGSDKSDQKSDKKKTEKEAQGTTEKLNELASALKDVETVKDLKKLQDAFADIVSPKANTTTLKSQTGTPDPISAEKTPSQSSPSKPTSPSNAEHESPSVTSPVRSLTPDDFVLEDAPRVETPRTQSPSAKKVSLLTLINESPQIIETCTKVLNILTQRFQRVSLSHSPAYQFTLEQMYLTAMEIRIKIDSQVATFTLIQSLTGNLVTLFKIRILKFFVEDSRTVATNLKSLMLACAELCNGLEKNARVNITDWKAVGEMQVTLADEVLETVPHRTFKLSEYVQQMSDLKFVQVLHYGKHGCVCKVVFNPTGAELALKIVPFSKIRFDSTNPHLAMYVDKSVCALASDPFLMKVHATWMVKPDAYIMLMDYPRSAVDVGRILEEIGYLDETTTGFIILQTVYAIEHIHFMGFIHRDVQPANIIIDRLCKVKLTDFDSARICRGHYLRKIMPSYFKKTAMEFRDQDLVGSVYFTAPEILKKAAYGRASDWWSLGVCIYKISSARLPFRGPDVSNKILNGNYIWGLNHSATVNAKEMVHDLLQKAPRKRLGSRVYSDILTHKYIQHYITAVDEIAPTDASCEGMVELSNPKYKIFLEEALMEVDLIDTLPEIKPPTPAKKYLFFKDISDLEISKHHNLFTYASAKFKKLIDRPASQMRDKEIYLVPCTPPIEEMDYSVKEMETTLGGSATKNLVCHHRDLQMERSHKILPYSGSGAKKKLEVEFMRTKADGRLFYLVVNKLTTKDSKSKSVMEGDIVVSIMKRDALDKSISEIVKILDFLLKTLPDGEEVSCCVLEKSTVRQLMKAEFAPIYKTATKTRLTVCRKDTICPYPNPDATKPHAFTTRRIKCEFSKKLYHVVWYIHPNLEVKETASLLFGDVLCKVNDKSCKSMTEEELITLIDSFGNTAFPVDIVEMSSLRRPDLLESAAGDEDEDPIVL